MPSIEKISASMFPEVYDSLLRELDPAMPVARWQLAFTPQWPCDEDHYGYALADGGRLVGMLGTIFSRRSIGGRSVPFCNLQAWYVKPEYRARSLLLMRPILARTDHVLTDFTAAPHVLAISQRLGMITLDRHAIVLPPLPVGARRGSDDDCDVGPWRGGDESLVAPADLQIYRDHQHLDCGHVLVRTAARYCYVVFSRIERHCLPYCLVHYVSDPALFAQQHAAVRAQLLRAARARYVAVEARVLDGLRVPFSYRVRAIEKIYRGAGVAPRDVDTLYSELALFKLSTLPTFRERASRTVKGCLPPPVRRYIEAARSARNAARAQ